MPELRGLTVHITDPHGANLQEWGTQYLRQHAQGSLVSTYIQSTTDVSFQVSVQPRIPFIEHETSPSGHQQDSYRRPSRRLRSSSEDIPMDQDHYAGQRNGSLTLSSPVPPPAGPNEQAAPAFSFIASLYLDGRRTPERKIIVYTDPNDKDFKSPDGKVLFKHRWVQSKNGRMTEHAWVFKEKAIETVFDRLIINGAQGDVEGQDEDAMAKAMESSCLATQETLGNDRSSVGQIIVEIQRVRLGKKRREENYRSKHTEGGDEGIDMDKVAKDITHATGFVHKNTLSSASLRVVDYWPYQPGEGPFATFKFFYRSLEQLQRFGFPGLSTVSKKSARTSQLLNDYALGLTPLSILSSMGSNCKDSKRAHESYEEKVKKRSFKPDGRSKQGFGLDYRDGGSSPPPGLPETNADDRGLKTMDISTVIPGVAPAGSASDPNLPVHARSRAIEGSPHYHPDLVPSTQPISAEIGKQPKVSSTAAVPSPKEGSPKPCLPFSSVNSSSAHDSFNIIRGFNNPLNTNSRLFPESTSLIMKTQSSRERLFSTDERNADRLPTGDPAQGDQGDDSDDDLATESDLETHADDDDYHYAPHPGEDEGYDSLRSEFKRVKLGKRSRAEVENTWLEDKAKKSLESTASSEGNVGDGRSPKDNTWTDAQTEDGGKTKKSRIEAENPTQDGQDLQRTTS